MSPVVSSSKPWWWKWRTVSQKFRKSFAKISHSILRNLSSSVYFLLRIFCRTTYCKFGRTYFYVPLNPVGDHHSASWLFWARARKLVHPFRTILQSEKKLEFVNKSTSQLWTIWATLIKKTTNCLNGLTTDEIYIIGALQSLWFSGCANKAPSSRKKQTKNSLRLQNICKHSLGKKQCLRSTERTQG